MIAFSGIVRVYQLGSQVLIHFKQIYYQDLVIKVMILTTTSSYRMFQENKKQLVSLRLVRLGKTQQFSVVAVVLTSSVITTFS